MFVIGLIRVVMPSTMHDARICRLLDHMTQIVDFFVATVAYLGEKWSLLPVLREKIGLRQWRDAF